MKSGQVQTGLLHGTVYQLEVGHRFDSVLCFYFILFTVNKKKKMVMWFTIHNVHKIKKRKCSKEGQPVLVLSEGRWRFKVWVSKLKLKLLCLLPSICNNKKNLLKQAGSFNRLAIEENLAINLSFQSKLSSLITSIQLQTVFNFSIPSDDKDSHIQISKKKVNKILQIPKWTSK